MATKKKDERVQDAKAEGPVTPLVIDGKPYSLKLTLGGLAEARRRLREEGVRINLLLSLSVDDMDADTLGAVLFGALQEYHHDLAYAAVKQMVRFDTYGEIILAICQAYQAATRPPETGPSAENPPAVA